MDIGDKKLSQIEEVLYRREIKSIEEKLATVGKALAAIFEPYYQPGKQSIQVGGPGAILKEKEKALSAFIQQGMATSGYYAGWSIRPQLPQLPDELKCAILAKVSKDFIERVANIEEIAQEVTES